MPAFTIRIGNAIVEIHARHDYVQKACAPYMCELEPTHRIVIDESLIQSERKKALKVNAGRELTPSEISDWFLEYYALLHKILEILPECNMLFMHGSAIKFDDKGYIFVAPSGTGKSTHTRIWTERYGDEVTVINDDKPFLSFADNKVFIHGTPWRGKHNIGHNITAELAGICILVRGERNTIKQLYGVDAVTDIIAQCNLHHYGNNTFKALDLIDQLLQNVPVYYLTCTPTMEAAEVCHDFLIK